MENTTIVYSALLRGLRWPSIHQKHTVSNTSPIELMSKIFNQSLFTSASMRLGIRGDDIKRSGTFLSVGKRDSVLTRSICRSTISLDGRRI